MSINERYLSLFETSVVGKKENFTGTATEEFWIKTGSRLVFSLQVASIDVGAQVLVTIKNGFSRDYPLDTILQISANGAGFFRRILTDFHNQFSVDIAVTGGSATYALGVTVNDNALSTRIENAEIEVDLDHVADGNGEFDSVRIGDGTDLMGVNADGSINVNIVQGPSPSNEIVKETYNEILSIASGSETQIHTYTVPALKTAKLQKIEFSGSNTAEYRYYKNNTVTGFKRTHHGSGLTGEFVYFSGGEEGIPLSSGDTVKITAKHAFRESGDFEARIQVLEIG